MLNTSRSRTPAVAPMPIANTGHTAAGPVVRSRPTGADVSAPSDTRTMPATRWPRKRSRARASAPERSLWLARAPSESIEPGSSESPTVMSSVRYSRDSAGSRSNRSSAAARAILACPSASATRMLRETSTSTGTTTSPAPTGGSRSTGRRMNRTTAANVHTRRATRVARCPVESGASGRRYSKNTAAATARTMRRIDHQGGKYAKYILVIRQGIFLAASALK